MKTQVIIPYRPHPSRQAGFEWVRDHYKHLFGENSVHVETETEEESAKPFNKSRLLNRAAERFPDAVLILNDAECLICDHAIQVAAKEAEASDCLIIPHDKYVMMKPEHSQWFLAKSVSARVPNNWHWKRLKKRATGGVWVVRADLFLSHRMNERFEGWGAEDTEILQRIKHRRYTNSHLYHFHHERASKQHLAKNKRLLRACDAASEPPAERVPSAPVKNVVLASYFNHTKDPQRRTYWPEDTAVFNPLHQSVTGKGVNCVILCNCFPSRNDGLLTFERVKADVAFTPNAFRWFAQLEWIERNQPERVFMVDSTDVQMLNDPFPELERGFLYVGHESETMANGWMARTQGRFLKIPDYAETIAANRSRPLLNCGVFGGYREDVVEFLRALTDNHAKHSVGLKTSSDMSIFNYTMLKGGFYSKVKSGPQVTTAFKKNETESTAWFKHK